MWPYIIAGATSGLISAASGLITSIFTNSYRLGQAATASEIVDAAKTEADKYIQEASAEVSSAISDYENTKVKSAEELASEARSAAGQAANDEAGIAKTQAKAASMMNSGSKLASALQGAQAAKDASTSGYENMTGQMLGVAQNAESNRLGKAANVAGMKTSNAQTKGSQLANNAMTTGQAKAGITTNTANQVASSWENAASDFSGAGVNIGSAILGKGNN